MERRFTKRGPAALLRAEADGLHAIAATGTIRVPQVLALGGESLELEWLDLVAPDARFGERFGRALGELHRATSSARYGWHEDNFIGATPQPNAWRDDWVTFWREQRLAPMLARLHAPRELESAVQDVVDTLPRCFDDGYVPRPCLIHGDL